METTNLNIIAVKAYLENCRVFNKSLTFKTAVLKVRYDNGSWDTIFRKVLNYAPLSISEKNFMEQYKALDFNQVGQISYLLDEKGQKIFGLYLKKYFKYDLNINTFIAKRSKKQYFESKMSDVLAKTKSAVQHVTLSLKKLRVYNINSENVTNI